MIKAKLDKLITENIYEINEQKLDPLLIAKKYKNEYSALIAALFAYGNVNAIIKFLNKIMYLIVLIPPAVLELLPPINIGIKIRAIATLDQVP